MAKRNKKVDPKYSNAGKSPGQGGVFGEVDVSALNVGNAAPKKKRHLGWIISGFVLVLFAGFGALVVTLAFVSDVTVLVASEPIGPNEVVEEGDLMPLSVPARIGAVGIPASELDNYIGRRVVGPVGEGSLVHPDQFVDASDSGFEKTVVGMALPPGENPQFVLRAGDVVTVYELSDNNVGFDGGPTSGANEIATAEVVKVSALQQADYFLISLRVDVADAELIIERSAQDRIAVALLEEGADEGDEFSLEEELVGEEVAGPESEQLDGEQVEDSPADELSGESPPVEEGAVEEDVAAAAEEEG